MIPVSFAEKIGSYLILVASPLIQNRSLPISRFKLPPRSLPNLTESLFCRRQLRSQFTSPEKCSPQSTQLSAVKGNSHLKQMLIRLAAETPYLDIYIGLTETSWWSANWSCLIYSSAQTIPVSLSSFPTNQSQLHIFAALP